MRIPGNHYSNSTIVDSLIAPFETPFWLEKKHWIVRCDEYRKETTYAENNRMFDLYSIPVDTDKFYYSREMLYSKLNNGGTNTTTIVSTQSLSLDLSSIINKYSGGMVRVIVFS